jgi:hypothetical protein
MMINESNERKHLLMFMIKQNGPYNVHIYKTFYLLTIIRSAAWEQAFGIYGENFPYGSSDSSVGGTVPLPAISGDLPGRISSFYLNNSTTDTAYTVDKIWCGIKAAEGSSDFNPVIELELGTLGSTDVALASDSDNAMPYGSTDNILTYACTTDEFKMVGVTLGQAFPSTTDLSDFMGDFLVLMRGQVAGTGTVKLQLKYGYSNGTDFISNTPLYFSEASTYRFWNMGLVTIPPFPRPQISASTLADPFNRLEFQIYTKHLGTANTVTLDCLVLIPASHMVSVTDANMTGDRLYHIYNLEDGQSYGLGYNTVTKFVEIGGHASINDFTYPIAGGILVLACEHTTGQRVYGNVNVDGAYFTRYRTNIE